MLHEKRISIIRPYPDPMRRAIVFDCRVVTSAVTSAVTSLGRLAEVAPSARRARRF